MGTEMTSVLVGGFFSIILWLGQRTTKNIDTNILRLHQAVERLADELSSINHGVDEIKKDLKNNYVTRTDLEKEFKEIDDDINDIRKQLGWQEVNQIRSPNIQRVEIFKPAEDPE